MVEGTMTPKFRSNRVVLEANLDYWNPARFPKLQRIIYVNTLSRKEALKLVMTGEGQVDLVTKLNPLKTLQVAESPFAKVVKSRGGFRMMFGLFNVRKAGSPWRDIRLRQAVNLAINRADFIRYATKGNGRIVPALISPESVGYDPTLAPYPFDPDKARTLLRDAGYAEGLSVHLISYRSREVQATVVSKMLEQIGLSVHLELVDGKTFRQQVSLDNSDLPPEKRAWDIALFSNNDLLNFPLYRPYKQNVVDGGYDWVDEPPELRQLYEQALGTVNRDKQQALTRQMERYVHAHAYFLFLYNPIELYAVNKAVQFVPHRTGILNLAETSVSDQHWSVRKQRVAVPR
jgi:peptide/nickel transport system substrate-binding protein